MNNLHYIIIGAGASGLLAAISLKEKYPFSDVTIIEKNNKIGKKIYATGNGKCNIGNIIIKDSAYNNGFATNIINENSINDLIKFLKEHNIVLKNKDGLLYPYSESAASVVAILDSFIEKLHIKVLLNTEMIDYIADDKITVICKENKYVCDKLIISTGGASSPIFGTDGSIFNILAKHKYSINTPFPSLCPVKTNNVSKLIDGVRVKARVSLYNESSLIHEEVGEVLFKNDGLSGICIFNCSAFIARYKNKGNFKIVLDLLYDYKEELKLNELDSFLNPKLLQYLRNIYKKDDELIKHLNKLEYNVLSLYSFKESQVTSGGVSIKNINQESFKGMIEDNIYFIGEVLDVDGLCGGYNLMWCFVSALLMVEKI